MGHRPLGRDSVLQAPDVAARRGQFGIVNPATAIGAAVRGIAISRAPRARGHRDDPVVRPARSRDRTAPQRGLARGHRGAEAPLRLALRDQRDHSVLVMIQHVLGTGGLSLTDIRTVGRHGHVRRGHPRSRPAQGDPRGGGRDRPGIRRGHLQLGRRWSRREAAVPLPLGAIAHSARSDRLPPRDHPEGSLPAARRRCPDARLQRLPDLLPGRRGRCPRDRVLPVARRAERPHRVAGRSVTAARADVHRLDRGTGPDPLHGAAERFWASRGYLS